MSIVVLGTAMAAFYTCAIVPDSSGKWNEWTELLHVPACSLAAVFLLPELALYLFRLPVRADRFGQSER